VLDATGAASTERDDLESSHVTPLRGRLGRSQQSVNAMQISAIRSITTGASGVNAVRGPEAVHPVQSLTREVDRVLPAGSTGRHRPAAVLQLSEEAVRLALGSRTASSNTAAPEATESAADGAAAGKTEATPEENRELQELKRRDREVRTHEQAHKAAGGAHAGSIHLEYSVGPDGKRYASSGEVSIDVSEVPGDPEATLRKMEIVQRAANAPAEPSGADRQVAAQAASTASRARAEMATERYAEAQGLAGGGRTTERSARGLNA
jgi:hypothetical protein